MKRKSFRYRAKPLLERLVRPNAAVGAKKIFIIKQVRVPANDVCKKIQSILIFDDHPDSLRLVFGRDASRHVPFGALRALSWEPIFAAILTMAALVGMFWPLL